MKDYPPPLVGCLAAANLLKIPLWARQTDNQRSLLENLCVDYQGIVIVHGELTQFSCKMSTECPGTEGCGKFVQPGYMQSPLLTLSLTSGDHLAKPWCYADFTQAERWVLAKAGVLKLSCLSSSLTLSIISLFSFFFANPYKISVYGHPLQYKVIQRNISRISRDSKASWETWNFFLNSCHPDVDFCLWKMHILKSRCLRMLIPNSQALGAERHSSGKSWAVLQTWVCSFLF